MNAQILIQIALGTIALDRPTTTAAPPRPNVVLILADDLGWADLGVTGAGFYETPNLDNLAARGLRFTSAYAACPVCSPTRAALMTGRNPARFGLTDWLPGRGDRPGQAMLGPELPDRLPKDVPTLAERLSEAGYRTAHIGKWHLGGEGGRAARAGIRRQRRRHGAWFAPRVFPEARRDVRPPRAPRRVAPGSTPHGQARR